MRAYSPARPFSLLLTHCIVVVTQFPSPTPACLPCGPQVAQAVSAEQLAPLVPNTVSQEVQVGVG